MKKPEIIAIKIGTAWKHTVVFLKLVKHKLDNGNLSGEWDSYSFAIINHFRATEAKLNEKLLVDERGGDRHSISAKQSQIAKRFTEHAVLFDKYAYDQEIREIIKGVDEKEKSKILS